MKKTTFILALLLYFCGILFSQTDATQETKFNLSGNRIVSDNENRNSSFTGKQRVPLNLIQQYNNAADSRNEEQKTAIGKEIEKFLEKPNTDNNASEMRFVQETPFEGDWYNSDIMISNTDVAFNGSYRQMDLKQGEDGWMYLAVNRRNAGSNGYLSVYRSSNGGATWIGVVSIVAPGYYSSISMLVESRNSSVPDSTRILLYSTYSNSSNFDNAALYCAYIRVDGVSGFIVTVASPSPGNRFEYVSTCSDGMFYSSATYMHAVVREETNPGTFQSLKHFRSIDWGATHSVGTLSTFNDDLFPACGYSNENGTDSIYIAVERAVTPTQHEIRLIAISDIPDNSYSVRYITDAVNGTLYQRPAIAIQQRHFSLPQRILVTCTKNNQALYHFSSDGGAVWNVDLTLGFPNQQVDYTTCSADTLTAGGKDFIAAFVDQNGDSITVRNGTLGLMGSFQYKRNGLPSTGVLSPACAIYKDGSTKNAALAYAGFGPTGVYYNMETLVTGIQTISSEIPSGFRLEQNYPNPFNPVTNIKFSIPKAGQVTLKVFDASGKQVAELVNQNVNAGTFNYDFDASHLSSGVYFYRLSTDGFTDVKKMMLVK